MFTVEQYRAKAIEYSHLVKIANGPNELHEYQRLERSFTELADNAQWLADNHGKTAHAAHEISPQQGASDEWGNRMNHSPRPRARQSRMVLSAGLILASNAYATFIRRKPRMAGGPHQ
jgi:hypothetical protein